MMISEGDRTIIRVSMVAMLLLFHRIGWGIRATGSGIGWVWIRDLEQRFETLSVLIEQGNGNGVSAQICFEQPGSEFLFGGRQLLHPRGSALGHVSGYALPQPHPTLDCQPFFDSMYRNAGKNLSWVVFAVVSHRLGLIIVCSLIWIRRRMQILLLSSADSGTWRKTDFIKRE
jgi:hypothetical protein